MLTDHPATRWVDAWRVRGELFYALDFTFCRVKHRCLAEWFSPSGYCAGVPSGMEKPQNFILRLSLFAPRLDSNQ